MKFKTSGWAISGWLVSIVLFVFMVINNFDSADTLSTMLKELFYPLVGESSQSMTVFLIVTTGMLILAIGFIGGVIVLQIKQSNNRSKFNGLYTLNCKGKKEDELHIIYVWNKPPFYLNGHQSKVIYRKYLKSSGLTPSISAGSFLYGLSCRAEASNSNNANYAALSGEENGIKIFIEIEKNSDDSEHSKITLNLIDTKQSHQVPKGTSETWRKEFDVLCKLQGDVFNGEFVNKVNNIVSKFANQETTITRQIQRISVHDNSLKSEDKTNA